MMDYFDKSIHPENLTIIQKMLMRDQTAQYVMNHCKKHPTQENYYLYETEEEDPVIFHVTQPSSMGLRSVYIKKYSICKCNGLNYKFIQYYDNIGRKTGKLWYKFIEECRTGSIKL